MTQFLTVAELQPSRAGRYTIERERPFFRLLGSPPAMKKHVIDEGGH